MFMACFKALLIHVLSDTSPKPLKATLVIKSVQQRYLSFQKKVSGLFWDTPIYNGCCQRRLVQ